MGLAISSSQPCSPDFQLQHSGDSWNLLDGSLFISFHHAWLQSQFSLDILLPVYKISQQKSLNALLMEGAR